MNDARTGTHDDRTADLRGVLAQVGPLLAFTAGQLAATCPESAERLVAAADEVARILARTAPSE